MKWSLVMTLFIAAVSLVLLAAGPGAGKASGDHQKFNLADLADGETRTFGEGDHAVTASRQGDDVTINYKGDDKSGVHTLHCAIGKDSCYAMTFSGDGKSRMVMLSKSAASDKDGEVKVVTKVVLAGDGAHGKDLVNSVSDDESGDHLVIAGDDSGMVWATDDEGQGISGAHPGVKVLKIVTDGGTVLRCPEGDATLTLKKGEEKSGPYFCPRHNQKMEPSKEPVVIEQKIKVEKKSATKDDEY